jgi:hypothetical protein
MASNVERDVSDLSIAHTQVWRQTALRAAVQALRFRERDRLLAAI